MVSPHGIGVRTMDIDDRLILKNKYSRPGNKNLGVKGLVVHWTGVPGQNAETVRRYFEKYAPAEKKYVSAHYAIDFDGSILQMIPDREVAYHVSYKDTPLEILHTHGYPNDCMIGIECCIINEQGEMTDQTKYALLWLLSVKAMEYNLFAKDLFRHYDLTVKRKDCHRWYVNNPDEWDRLKSYVMMSKRFMTNLEEGEIFT